jgi:2-(1,2-epoxy-1,2-dihydrophenyl)acetyl-CoA isomerase
VESRDGVDIDTGTPYLRGWRLGRLAVLSFNQPSKRNALRFEIYEALARLLREIALDQEVGCLVLTGEGESFCAGGDVKEFATRNAADPRERPASLTRSSMVDLLRARHRDISLALHRMPKITVAVLPGPAAGGGLSIALACDLRVAVHDAILTTAFAKIGTSGDFGGSWFLTQLVGPAKAKELFLFSPRLTAQEAKELGIVNTVFAREDFAAQWLRYAQDIADGPTAAYRAMKENINRALESDLATALDAEAVNMMDSFRTADHREAVAAFMAKRPPVFTGR